MKTFARLLALFGFAVFSLSAAETKYNVLFIASDDMRPELGCYGNALIKSPNIDKLAAKGLLFNHAYCQYALCNPSRSSLLTGRRPESTKIYNLETFFRTYNSNVVTLPQFFKNSGYDTRNFGKIFHNGNGNHDDNLSWSVRPWHSINDDPSTNNAAKSKKQTKADTAKKSAKAEGDPDEDPNASVIPYGDPDVPDNGLQDGQTTDHAIAAMRQMKDHPFFLAVGFHRPHLPFVAPKKYWDLYDPAKIALAPNPFHPKDSPAFANNDASEIHRYKGVPKGNPLPDDLSRKLIHGYYASISYTDAQVGKVLDELDALGLRDKTIIVFWGDHGYQLGEHATWNKRTDWEICARVPLIVSVPNQKTAGVKADAMVEFVDLYPTLAELCGLTPSEDLEGASFVRLLNDAKQPWKTAVFTTYVKKVPAMGGQTFGRSMCTDRYRFTEWHCEKSGKTEYELYDHQTDPQENASLALKPENKDLMAKLTAQLHEGWKGALPPKR